MDRKLLMVILDGLGVRQHIHGNAWHLAHTPRLDFLTQKCSYRTLKAHGTFVGLPSDADMGNSEVGHNAIGSGQICDQGAKLVDESLSSERLFQSATWKALMERVVKGHTLHFLGLLSDGKVHSHEHHLYQLVTRAVKDGVRTIRLHVLTDGRDVPEKTGLIYGQKLEAFCRSFSPSVDIRVASGGGRMVMTMDRYEADWSMVERGWKAHVLGQAPYAFESLTEALEAFPDSDQHRPPFVITDKGQPLGPVMDGDGVVLFNFRGDRAIQISRAFEEKDFSFFDRQRHPDVMFCGMMEYDGDLKIPKQYLVEPPLIQNTLGEFLASQKIRQFAASETQKFGHVTYFWNGNRSGYWDQKFETYWEVPSDQGIIFDQKPWMKAWEITERTIQAMKADSFDFGRINYPNPDMVGHTGNLDAAVAAITWVDHMLGKLFATAAQTGHIVMVTADHGNAEEMYQSDTSLVPKTSHTLSPVPCGIFDPKGVKWTFRQDLPLGGLANLANTCLQLLGMPERSMYQDGLLLSRGVAKNLISHLS